MPVRAEDRACGQAPGYAWGVGGAGLTPRLAGRRIAGGSRRSCAATARVASALTWQESVGEEITTPEGTLVITYTGLVSGDTFEGTVDLGGFAQAAYNGVRVTPLRRRRP